MDIKFDNILIIGCGAIGKALSVFLKHAGRKVTLIRASVDDGSSKWEQLRVTMADGTTLEAEMSIRTLATFETVNGLIVLTNKSFGNGNLARVLQVKAGRSPIVLLQNGLGIEQPFLGSSFPSVYRCVLFVTSQTTDHIEVRFKPVSACPIGIIKGNKHDLHHIVQQLNVPNFPFREEIAIQPIIWRKAIINSAFNSICPLLDVDNGIFFRDSKALEIARRIMAEGIAVARTQGIFLKLEDVEENLLQISRSADGQLISTLQDIRNKRNTEIDTLNLEMVNLARSLNKEDTVTETRLLGELTKLKASINLEVTD